MMDHCESPLSGCVYKKRVKMKNKWHFTTSCVWDILLNFVLCHILCIFLNFQLLAKMLNSIKFIKVTWKLGYLRRLNFFYFISSCKIIDLFQDVVSYRVEVPPSRIIRTRFQDPLQFVQLIGHI